MGFFCNSEETDEVDLLYREMDETLSTGQHRLHLGYPSAIARSLDLPLSSMATSQAHVEVVAVEADEGNCPEEVRNR